MSTINSRISDLIEYFSGGNNSDFGNKLGVNEANIRNYINGTEPKFSFLEKICKNFEINYEWLLLGNGEMLKTNIVVEPNDDCNHYKELAEERAYTIQMQKQVIENLQQELKLHKKTSQSTMPDVLHQSTR